MLTESPVFYEYGITATNTAAALSRFQEERNNDPQAIQVFEDAVKLLNDAVVGGKILDPKSTLDEKQLTNSGPNAVGAFGSALSAIQACGRDIDQSQLDNIINELENITSTLVMLKQDNNLSEVSDLDIITAKRYFDCLADTMIAAINNSSIGPLRGLIYERT